jgi:hypothetical protein
VREEGWVLLKGPLEQGLVAELSGLEKASTS